MVDEIARSHSRIGMAVLTYLLVLAFLGAGAVKLIPIEFERTNFIHFGYALWFMDLIGVVEIAGALLMISASTRAMGALLNAAVMVGAVCSHLRAGDGIGMATPALILLLLLLVVAAAHRDTLRDGIGARLVSRSV